MASDCNNNQRKPLLYADLFKSHKNIPLEKEKQDAVVSKFGSSSSSSSTLLSLSCDSSSSGFSTPLYSELGSAEGDDGDFIAELTRQMAECMLQEDEEEEEEKEEDNTVVNYVYGASRPAKNNADESYVYSGAVDSLQNGFYTSSLGVDDQTPANIQVYELKNQPPVSKEGKSRRGKRVKRTESAQQKQNQKTEQKYMKYRGIECGIGDGRNGYSGSGLQAVFLGGSRQRVGSTGTGVFLPRDPIEIKNKSGCSTVLIPTRVLQLLELHFSRRQDSTAPPMSGGSSLQDESTSDGGPQLENREVEDDETQLPHEWTY